MGVYTSYLSNIKYIPRDCVKFIIMRNLPSSLNPEKYGCKWVPSFAPSQELKDSYKNSEIDFSMFSEKYINEMKATGDLELLKDLGKVTDVVLICCEKDFRRCHRSLLASLLTDDWREL